VVGAAPEATVKLAWLFIIALASFPMLGVVGLWWLFRKMP
jgi:hypothetical protein